MRSSKVGVFVAVVRRCLVCEPARAAKLSPARRREIAVHAIRKRWGYEE